MSKLFSTICAVALLATSVTAQSPVESTPAADRLAAKTQRDQLATNSLFQNVEFRSVGPTVMSGRVTDLEVDPADATHFYVAYASGGLWETHNNGQSFEPLFDNEAVMTIGDIAVDWNNNIIWVGTGENNSSRSSYAGVGLYRSSDSGASWQHQQLGESHHIGRIIVHPSNPGIIFVTALGPLYSSGGAHGVYKTTNFGDSWEVLKQVPNAGAVDLVMDPTDSNTLYAAFWERDRKAWDFKGSGVGSGIWKTTDGGNEWQKITGGETGFPEGEGIGRIGLDIALSEPNVLYAVLDNQFRKEKEADEDQGSELEKDDFRTMSPPDFAKLENEQLTSFLRDNGFPKKHTAASVKASVAKGDLSPVSLVDYLEDANRELFDTPVIGAQLYRSSDAGKTWQLTHEAENIEQLVFSYGYYFGQVRVAPTDPNTVYLSGVPIITSTDGGKTFASVNGKNVHADHHALWINPDNANHLINGNDGGINISYDEGKNWVKCNTPAVGQFYTVAVDNAKPYNVYGGLQDNGVWKGPSTYKASDRWHQTGHYPYKILLGGDGFQVAVDPRDNNTVYTGSQFGYYFRVNATTGSQTLIRPQHKLGERPLRFNWQTPIHLSVHSPEILYLGSNKFHRSMNQGAEWNLTSKDLTLGGKKGNVPYGTISALHESPMRFGLLYVGTDDGLVHISKDAGQTWTNITGTLPKNYWVSRVQASAHEEGTVYVTLNGYRWDNMKALVFRSIDFGTTWQQIGTDLPAEPVNVILEDPENPKLLFVGTDHGLYASINGGASFLNMTNNMPAAPVHDLAIQQREHDLVVGTHGRSIYIANIEQVQQLNEEIVAKALHIFPPNDVKHSEHWGATWNKWLEPREPEFALPFYVSASGKVTVQVETENGKDIVTQELEVTKGLNYFRWNLEVPEAVQPAYEKAMAKLSSESKEDAAKHKKAGNDRWYLLPGKYTIQMTAGEADANTTLNITAK